MAGDLPLQCKNVDQATYALITDLKQRGLLDDTLVSWGGEFGRTVYCQGALTRDNYGRDHHPKCFPVWFAGGGIKKGVVYGETDDFCYNVVENPGLTHHNSDAGSHGKFRVLSKPRLLPYSFATFR